MTYSESEDGFNDTIEVSLQKMRCSMQTMQEHEKLGGNWPKISYLILLLICLFIRATIHKGNSIWVWRSHRKAEERSFRSDDKFKNRAKNGHTFRYS